jgi:1-pyrroline-4-hydroxy-2-carboxylate deaminase
MRLRLIRPGVEPQPPGIAETEKTWITLIEDELMNFEWRGIFPAVTTQFRADQALDVEASLRHFEEMVAAGIDGMIVLGTVGENCSLEFREKLDVLKASVAKLGGRVPILAGVAEYTTALACRFAESAQDAGVDGLMVLPAMVYKSDRRETITHYRAVARSVDLPIMCYNNPVSYAVDVTPEMFEELADEPRFVAIKESSEDCRRITEIKNRCGDRYVLFCGVDDLALESAMLGAAGWVSGLSNAFPAESRLLWDLAMAGRYEEAVGVYRWYSPLLKMDTHPKLVQYIKLAAAECGYGTETVRAPRLPLVDPERSEILAVIRRAIETRPAVKRAAVRSDGAPITSNT